MAVLDDQSGSPTAIERDQSDERRGSAEAHYNNN